MNDSASMIPSVKPEPQVLGMKPLEVAPVKTFMVPEDEIDQPINFDGVLGDDMEITSMCDTENPEPCDACG